MNQAAGRDGGSRHHSGLLDVPGPGCLDMVQQLLAALVQRPNAVMLHPPIETPVDASP
jgi:hypothetical protein